MDILFSYYKQTLAMDASSLDGKDSSLFLVLLQSLCFDFPAVAKNRILIGFAANLIFFFSRIFC